MLSQNDWLLMLYVLASIVFLYHQWLRWDLEKLEKTIRQGGVRQVTPNKEIIGISSSTSQNIFFIHIQNSVNEAK